MSQALIESGLDAEPAFQVFRDTNTANGTVGFIEGVPGQGILVSIGSPLNYGSGMLRQQWKMSQFYERAAERGLLPATDR